MQNKLIYFAEYKLTTKKLLYNLERPQRKLCQPQQNKANKLY